MYPQVTLMTVENPNLRQFLFLPRIPVVGDNISIPKPLEQESLFYGNFLVRAVIFVVREHGHETQVWVTSSSSKTEARIRLESGATPLGGWQRGPNGELIYNPPEEE